MERQTGPATINNAFYDHLHDDWYSAFNHPIALLRAENKVRNPWIAAEIQKRFKTPISLLDIGCGAGLLTNALALDGHQISGIDLSEQSLKIAQKKDQTKSVNYQVADAYKLPFPNATFDVVCAMDILEHVENPNALIQEASRVLKKGGIFFFHTFNRNLLSYMVIIKGVDWCVQNAPKNMHVYPLFIKPKELRILCRHHKLDVLQMVGLRPSLTLPFFKMIFTRKIPPDFSFCFSKNLLTGYCGSAQKQE
jgi:2-polyprenyl-6-hydroxyphenyl methylase/3-demethylubiquinone-9 3-methyltransferase